MNNSAVGAINTGNVKKIDVAMDHIKLSGNNELVAQLKTFTEAVIESTEIGQVQMDEIIEHLGFLGAQLMTETSQRSPSVVKTVIDKVKDIIAVSASLTTLWQVLIPQLDKLLAGIL